jgi:hypothetical protein
MTNPILSVVLVALLSSCAGPEPTVEVPVLEPYDCAAAQPENMGASTDPSATFQIWLDGSQLYDCHSQQTPPCPASGGTPYVYDCKSSLL